MHLVSDPPVFTAIALGVTAVAAVVDYRTGHIPNWLTIGGLSAGTAVHLVWGAWLEGIEGLKAAAITLAIGIVLCSAVPLVMSFLAKMGGGDLKLLAAIGAICGPLTGFQAQTYAFIAMFVYVLGRLAYEGKLFRMWFRVLSLLIPRWRKRAPISPELMVPLRFGPAILVGLCVALFTG